MNLYNLHINQESLLFFVEASEVIPTLFWAKYKNNPEELKKRERYIAADAEYSYLYARHVLKGPFPAGEAVIAQNASLAIGYAADILKGPFPAGEAAIATDDECALEYVNDVIKKDFYLDGKLIAKY